MGQEAKARTGTILILGGPNGAGKTTAARIFLPEFLGLDRFVNADELARGLDPANPEGSALAAGRLMLTRIHELIEARESFAFESTLAGKSYARLLEQCKSRGWRIILLYLWLPSPDLAIERVARRVREGGHSIPADVIRRRYRAGLDNLSEIYLPLADEARIYDNSVERVLVAEKSPNSPLRICDAERWGRLKGDLR
jgi:predicted ABC-type ATPase